MSLFIRIGLFHKSLFMSMEPVEDEDPRSASGAAAPPSSPRHAQSSTTRSPRHEGGMQHHLCSTPRPKAFRVLLWGPVYIRIEHEQVSQTEHVHV